MLSQHKIRGWWVFWALFLIRGMFYSTMLPLWEGWDEYAHFAWLEHWNERGTLPLYTTPVPREVELSLELTPLAGALEWMGPGHFVHEKWWALSNAERLERSARLNGLRGELRGTAPQGSLVFYEAQQPPLYYWLAAVPERFGSHLPLQERVLLVRLFSLLLASAVIPLTWFAARTLLPESGAALCVALLAIAPGLAIDTSRVANDGLAIVLAAVVLLALLKRWPGWILGFALGAALLSKAYLLSLIPAVIWVRRKQAWQPLAIAIVLAGWWYGRNLSLGYSMSGWLDRAEPGAIMAAITQVSWPAAFMVVSKSFIWFGAWSFLTLKSWAYVLLEVVGGAGFALALRRKGLEPVWAMPGFHVLAICYGVLVGFAAHHESNVPGWYLWPMAAPLAVLLVSGLGRWTLALVALLGVADVYGAAALMVPYYAGLAARNKANAGRFLAGLDTLGVPEWLALAWLLATAAIVVIAVYRSGRNPDRMTQETPSSNPAT